MLLFDQSPDDALATGQSHTRFVSISDAATNQPLRVTLVWTDPPGNPAASLKLVNNLDLVVTNLDTGEVFFGNDFPAGGCFNAPWDTNTPPNLDVVNNVENVFLAPPLGTNYSVTVLARSVNVNAVTAQSTNVAQDYALVISSGDGDVPDALTFTERAGRLRRVARGDVSSPTPSAPARGFPARSCSTSAPAPTRRCSTSAPFLGPAATNGLIAPGTLSQWHFYVLTNDQGYTNAAFVTFQATQLALPQASASQTNLTNSRGHGCRTLTCMSRPILP